MNKIIKNKILIACVLITFICVAISVLASQKASGSRKDLNEERYLRMVAEEKLEKLNEQVRRSEIQNEQLQKELEDVKAVNTTNESVIAGLKIDLEKAKRFSEVLQRELQNALVDPVKQ